VGSTLALIGIPLIFLLMLRRRRMQNNDTQSVTHS
jgi:hypothetical protein